MVIERFVAHRGVLDVIWFENGTNFIATEKKLRNNVQNWNQQTLTDSLVKKSINWKFNPPSTPHHGGVWERLVHSSTHTLYANLGNRRLTNEILSSTFCFVEHSLNVRPLVLASADATELNDFTLNHFLLGIADPSLPSLANCNFDHRQRYATARGYSDAIWSRWLKKYIPSLNSRTKWPSSSNRELKTGDLLWIVEPTTSRDYYSFARVVKFNFDSDVVGRSAEVRTACGNLIHPVVKLAPVLPLSDSGFKNVFINVDLSILA